MAIASKPRVWTWEEALELPDGDRYEVIDGALKQRIMSFRNAVLATRIAAMVAEWSDLGHPGTVTGSDGGYTIFSWSPGDVRMPDVSYISRDRLRKSPSRGWVDVAPEFAVEVVSPTDRITDLEDKARDYIRAGVDLVWVVVPSTQSVHVWRKDGSRSVLQSGETLSGESVLDGFTVDVADLFEEDE